MSPKGTTRLFWITDVLAASEFTHRLAKVRREYVHLLVDRIEVGDRHIRITGRNAALERAVVASQTPGAAVPRAERKWRARRDSNPRPRA